MTLLVALGSQRYRVERPFYAPSGGTGMVSDAAVDPAGNVHVLMRRDPLVDAEGPAVASLAPDGSVMSLWGGDLIADAHMLSVAPDGRLFIVDRDSHEVVIAYDGKRVGGIGKRNVPLAPFNHPTAVAFGPDRTIYVSDGYANHRIHRFAADGTPLVSWGELGGGPGQFRNPHAIWALPDGRVVVVDRENDRLQVFTAEGVFLAIWPGFVKPLDLWGDPGGRLYVTDLVPTLTLLAPTGERLGCCRPVLNGAHGISGDAAGNLYLAEPSPSRVARLVPV